MAPLGAPEALRDRILDHLRDVGTDSISGIARSLSEGREHPIHRLTVTGYLRCLAEEGVLREVDRPPSRHYALADPARHRSLYEKVGAAVRDEDTPPERRAALAAAVLERLFSRPVFLAELQATGHDHGRGLRRPDVAEPQRRRIRALLDQAASPHPEVPHGDPFVVAEERPGLSAAVDQVLRRLLLDGAGAGDLAMPGEGRVAQATLRVEDQT